MDNFGSPASSATLSELSDGSDAGSVAQEEHKNPAGEFTVPIGAKVTLSCHPIVKAIRQLQDQSKISYITPSVAGPPATASLNDDSLSSHPKTNSFGRLTVPLKKATGKNPFGPPLHKHETEISGSIPVSIIHMPLKELPMGTARSMADFFTEEVVDTVAGNLTWKAKMEVVRPALGTMHPEDGWEARVGALGHTGRAFESNARSAGLKLMQTTLGDPAEVYVYAGTGSGSDPDHAGTANTDEATAAVPAGSSHDQQFDARIFASQGELLTSILEDRAEDDVEGEKVGCPLPPLTLYSTDREPADDEGRWTLRAPWATQTLVAPVLSVGRGMEPAYLRVTVECELKEDPQGRDAQNLHE